MKLTLNGDLEVQHGPSDQMHRGKARFVDTQWDRISYRKLRF